MKTKVLEVCGRMDIGGAQAVGANIAKYADDSFSFCYLILNEKIGEYEEVILSRGHRILHWPAPAGNMLKFLLDLTRLIREEQFDVVHSHTMFNCGFVMLAARLAGARGRISHSHTTKEECAENFVRKAYRALMRLLIHTCGTEFWACGVDAGKVLYGDRWFTPKGTVITNGIDTAAYGYDPAAREAIRAQYGTADRFVIGHVGHYVTVKNQSFLLRFMPELLEQQPNAVMLLFGEGEDRQMLQEKIRSMGLEESVRLMGNVRNIGQVLSSFDVFVFPSLFEGTPLALIEAQANGLPCVISDTIPPDACLVEGIRRLSLDAAPDEWIDSILQARRSGEDHTGILLSRYQDVRESMQEMYKRFHRYREER